MSASTAIVPSGHNDPAAPLSAPCPYCECSSERCRDSLRGCCPDCSNRTHMSEGEPVMPDTTITDIVQRLRGHREEFDNGTFCWSEPVPWMREAADEIEALRAALRATQAEGVGPGWGWLRIKDPVLIQVDEPHRDAVARAFGGVANGGSFR